MWILQMTLKILGKNVHVKDSGENVCMHKPRDGIIQTTGHLEDHHLRPMQRWKMQDWVFSKMYFLL